jgi:hypothetical protein
MQQHAAQLAAAKIPFIFDPGQGLPMFDGTELTQFIDQATWMALNDYEARMLCERTGRSLEQLSDAHLRGVVVTLGAAGCDVWERGQRTHVPGVAAREVVDPTGCGDAFRAALLYGLERDWSLQRCAELGNRVGAIKIAQRGGQNHVLYRTELGHRLKKCSSLAAERRQSVDHGYPKLAHLRARLAARRRGDLDRLLALVRPKDRDAEPSPAEEREGPPFLESADAASAQAAGGPAEGSGCAKRRAGESPGREAA